MAGNNGLISGPCRFGLWALALLITVSTLALAAITQNKVSREEFRMHCEHGNRTIQRIENGVERMNEKIDQLSKTLEK